MFRILPPHHLRSIVGGGGSTFCCFGEATATLLWRFCCCTFFFCVSAAVAAQKRREGKHRLQRRVVPPRWNSESQVSTQHMCRTRPREQRKQMQNSIQEQRRVLTYPRTRPPSPSPSPPRWTRSPSPPRDPRRTSRGPLLLPAAAPPLPWPWSVGWSPLNGTGRSPSP